MAFEVSLLRDRLMALSGGRAPGLHVAFSGGMDSSVLLVAAAEAWDGRISAIHVDHGLQAASSDWARHCQARCAALGVECRVLRVHAHAAPGQSPEAAARAARYGALAAAIGQGEVLLTAHHADDQLETVLLQLMRGSGVAGLAAMPERAPLGPGELWRPLLDFGRADLAAWADSRGLEWVDDPSNRDTRRARNHLRQEVVPSLKAYWPAAAAAAARSARHCAEAAGLLDDLARADAQGCADGPALDVARLQALSRARRANVVRWAARDRGLPVPDHRRLDALLEQLECAGHDANPRVHWPGAVAARFREHLYLLPETAFNPPAGAGEWRDPGQPLALGGGRESLTLAPTQSGGLDPGILDHRPWSVGFRRGGERLQLPGRVHRSELKKLFHAAGVPPWERARTPLVFVAGDLVAVGDRWVVARWWRAPGNKALRVQWDRPEGLAKG